MDHVPVPANCSRIPLEVPYIAQDEFDGLDFKDFAVRRGWTLPQLSQVALAASTGNASESDKAPAAAFLQSWLYFGLLDSMLGRHVDPSTFVRPNADGKPILDTKRLPEVLSEWATQEPHEPKSSVLCRAKSMNLTLSYAALMLRSFGSGPRSILSHSLWLSIASLCDILTLAKLAIVGHRAGDSQELVKEAIAGQHTGFGCDFVSLGLFQHWCPYDVERLYQTANPSTMYFAGHLAPVRHNDHSACSKSACSAPSSLPHSAQHQTPDCQCSEVKINGDQLSEILQHDEFPIVSLTSSGDKISASVQPAHQGPYIAISHVWSDGLGNEAGNSLTMCQLARLSTLIRQLKGDSNDGNLRLWIDTLCVPFSGPDRRKSIAMMAQIYRDAECVLALDSGLSSAKGNVSPEELLVHIVNSRWASRLWTLQEGSFAKKLHFQFLDTTIDLDELTKTEIDHTNLTGLSEYVIYANLHNNLLNMRMVGSETSSREQKRAMINGVLNLLLWRQTTKAIDEWTCFSTILGHDVTAILQAEPSQRPAIALGQQIFFPKNIIFNSGPRQSTPGLRWAPKSFLRPPRSHDVGSAGAVGSESEAMCTSEGLFVRLPAMELSPPSPALQGAFEVYNPEANSWLRVVLCDEEASLEEQFDSIQPRTDSVWVDPEDNTPPYPSWVLIFDEKYRPRDPGAKDTAVVGYVAGAASLGRGYEGFVVRFVQRVIVVTTTAFADNIVPGPDLSYMHGQFIDSMPCFIG